MSVEAATYISQLDPSLPADGDDIPEGDNHIRLGKQVLQNQFPNLGAAAVSVTAAQLNDVVNKAPLASPTFTGTPAAPTASNGTSTTQLATTAFVQAAIAAVNAASGELTRSVSSAASFSVGDGQLIAATNSGAVAATFPPSPTVGTICGVVFDNGRTDNTVNIGANSVIANGVTISGVVTIDQMMPVVWAWYGDYWRPA